MSRPRPSRPRAERVGDPGNGKALIFTGNFSAASDSDEALLSSISQVPVHDESKRFQVLYLSSRKVRVVGGIRKALDLNRFGSSLSVAMRERRIMIPNRHGENLVGMLHETGSRELVILCHGFQSSKERIPMVNLAGALERDGISAFRFDFAGNGESEGSFQYGNYWREVDDLRAVIEYFLGQKRFVKAIIGHSKGGNVVLLYASKYNDINTVINLSGRFNLERGIEGRLGKDFLQRIKKNGYIDVKNKRGKFEYRVTEESLMDRLTTDTRTSSQMISRDCRVLTVHGSSDKIVPAEDSLEFAKVISNHKLCIIEGADHEYTSHQDELTLLVLDFVKTDSYPNKGTVNPFPPSKPANSPHSRL